MKRILILILGILLLAGCSSAPPTLEGAKNPDKLTVYPNSQLDPKQGLAGATMEGDEGRFYAKYWELLTTDPDDKVLEFYKKACPAAQVDKSDAGGMMLTWMDFPGSDKGEYIQYYINEGKIRISECLRFGKHKQ